MSLSRKDFADLAATLRTAHSEIGNPPDAISAAHARTAHQVVCMIEGYIADLCARHNARFDRQRFLDACQPGEVTPRTKVA